MAWELPPSITRTLDRFAISRVQRLEGDDTIVPTAQVANLDLPPFRSRGRRFYTVTEMTSGAGEGATSYLSLVSTALGAFAVVDQIILTANVSGVIIRVGVADTIVNGVIQVATPEERTPTGVSIQPLQHAALQFNFGGAGAALMAIHVLANTPIVLPVEVLLGNTARHHPAMYVWNNQPTTTTFVSYSGRLWSFEE